jgi:hypothetical protein
MDIGYIALGVFFLILSYLVWQLRTHLPEPEDETYDWRGEVFRYYYLQAYVLLPFLFLLAGAFFIILGITR